jgi:glyoxylate reductase
MAAPRVYVTRSIPEAGLRLLREHAEARVWEDELPPPRDVLLREAADADGLLTLLTEKVDAELLEHAPRLKGVSQMAVGYDNIDVAACTARGIAVANTPDVLTDTTADLAFALILATSRRIVEADRYTREGKWKTWGPTLLLGQDVHNATLGILGLGRIGAGVARRARGFDMQVLYNDGHRNGEMEAALGVEFRDMYDLLRESDFVSIHTRLTEETRHMIGARELACMKPSAVLINTSRGPVVDQKALYEALRDRRIWAAGLDVFEEEPLSLDDPLLTLDNVVVLPHIGSASYKTRDRMAEMAAENLLAVLRGERAPNTVNPEVYGEPGARPGSRGRTLASLE